MGGRETGSLSNLLPGHREAAQPRASRTSCRVLGGRRHCRRATGLTAIELFEQMQAGKIKAVWIACTNPAQSLPDQNSVREALAACPFVVLQEAFRTTETAAFADLSAARRQLGREGRHGDQLRTAHFPRSPSHRPHREKRGRIGQSP